MATITIPVVTTTLLSTATSFITSAATKTIESSSTATVTTQTTPGVSEIENIRNILITVLVTVIFALTGAGAQQWRIRGLNRGGKALRNTIADLDAQNKRLNIQIQSLNNQITAQAGSLQRGLQVKPPDYITFNNSNNPFNN